MDQQISPENLREAARFFQDEVIGALDAVSDVAFPLDEGDLRRFPRESEEAQAASEGFLRLRESFERIVAQLHAGAVAVEVARERDIELPPELFAPLRPYLDHRGSEAEGTREGH
jgi:hypothetical protein